MAAVNRLPRYRSRIEALISGLPLSSSDWLERARAQRQEWRLMNEVLPMSRTFLIKIGSILDIL
jgi:hypothetical protein